DHRKSGKRVAPKQKPSANTSTPNATAGDQAPPAGWPHMPQGEAPPHAAFGPTYAPSANHSRSMMVLGAGLILVITILADAMDLLAYPIYLQPGRTFNQETQSTTSEVQAAAPSSDAVTSPSQSLPALPAQADTTTLQS